MRSRWAAAQSTVWSFGVVVFSPFFDQDLFILHDGLLVKEFDADYAAWVLQCRFEGYCVDHGWPLEVRPAVSLERNKQEKKASVW